jgi:hypothetical protein
MVSFMFLRLFSAFVWKRVSKEALLETGGIVEVTDIGRWREKKEDTLTSGIWRWSVGGTWGKFSAGAAGALFLPVWPVSFLVVTFWAVGLVCCRAELGLSEPSGGIEAFEDDNRR